MKKDHWLKDHPFRTGLMVVAFQLLLAMFFNSPALGWITFITVMWIVLYGLLKVLAHLMHIDQ